jgi:hypothetical protein
MAEGLKLVQPFGEQLGNGRLGAMNPETPIQFTELFRGEIHRIRTLTLQR